MVREKRGHLVLPTKYYKVVRFLDRVRPNYCTAVSGVLKQVDTESIVVPKLCVVVLASRLKTGGC